MSTPPRFNSRNGCLFAAVLIAMTSTVVSQRSIGGQTGEVQDLSWAERSRFVKLHNRYRSEVSPPAADMRRMTWDEELQKLAETRAGRCSATPLLEVPSTTKFSSAGELAFATAERMDRAEVIQRAVESWNTQGSRYDYDTNSCADGSAPPAWRLCNAYKQLVWADSYKVGCAIARCRSEVDEHQFVYCYYGEAGNTYTEESGGRRSYLVPYKTGEACEKCAEGFVCREGLCSSATDLADEWQYQYQNWEQSMNEWREEFDLYKSEKICP